MRSLTIQIPQPCHERWDDMQPNEQGRFCASCQKTVVDYTALSDQELVRLLSKTSGSSCGRLRNEQLDRPLGLANPSIASSWRHWVGLLTMSLFGWQTARAQLNPARKPAQPASIRPDFAVNTLPARTSASPPTKMDIVGRAMLMDSAGNLSPALEAYVSISLHGENWQTQTDSTGAFSLQVPGQLQVTDLKIQVMTPGRASGNSTFSVSPSTCSVVLNDIVLQKPMAPRTISTGGLVLIKTPSRWQKLTRKLFK
ncbi:hypothetical protein [Spirosoma pollinicola]|uniref:Carboxypeptidase regulatory-like domain-containing protein n=1 Tax=Spirosoma pollinicola TaxID=2057025 RepID=A0A2K8YY60_9BACT|nr:hypothetical protein [Spirosoma pollinicola]AUD02561.1 hypothetical protein CWM47_12400 [Spirosoma pollinicola]